MDEDAKRDVLGEQMYSEIQTIRELVSVIPSMNERLARVEGDVHEIKGELVVHRHILTEHSMILKEHSQMLEQHTQMLMELQTDIKELKATSHVHA